MMMGGVLQVLYDRRLGLLGRAPDVVRPGMRKRAQAIQECLQVAAPNCRSDSNDQSSVS